MQIYFHYHSKGNTAMLVKNVCLIEPLKTNKKNLWFIYSIPARKKWFINQYVSDCSCCFLVVFFSVFQIQTKVTVEIPCGGPSQSSCNTQQSGSEGLQMNRVTTSSCLPVNKLLKTSSWQRPDHIFVPHPTNENSWLFCWHINLMFIVLSPPLSQCFSTLGSPGITIGTSRMSSNW